jgi:SNF family Na+-dependent transporter
LLICHWIIKDGAKTSGKIMIVTATAPFVIFFLLVLRGLFLEGAWEGIVYLFKPNWSLIFTPSIWIDATTQVFYQLSIGMGTIINISSQKARRDDIVRSVILVPAGLVLCGILSALTIFIYLSHFCLINGLTIGDPSLKISGF